MYFPDLLRPIVARYVANPREELLSLSLGLLCITAFLPALHLYITLFSQLGAEWVYLSSNVPLNMVSQMAIILMILSGIGVRVLNGAYQTLAIKAFACCLGVSSICGVIVFAAAH